MADKARGDDVYQPPEDDGRLPASGQPDMENTLEERDLDDEMAEGYSPPERPLAVEAYGTTDEEEHEGESLDRRLARERPDVAPDDSNGIGDVPHGEGEPREQIHGQERAGRITAVNDTTGRRTDVYGEDVGIDGGAASAEEASVHIADESVTDSEGEEDGRQDGEDGEDRDA